MSDITFTTRAAVTTIFEQFTYSARNLVYFGTRSESSYSQVPDQMGRLMTGDAAYSLMPHRRQRLAGISPHFRPLPRREPR